MESDRKAGAFSFELDGLEFSFGLTISDAGDPSLSHTPPSKAHDGLCFVVAGAALVSGIDKLLAAVKAREGMFIQAPGGFSYQHENPDELEPGVTVSFMDDDDLVLTEEFFTRFVVQFVRGCMAAFEELGKPVEEASLRTNLASLQESGRVMEAVKALFKEDGWPVQEVEARTALRLRFEGKNGAWSFLAIVREDEKLVTFYSIVDTLVPEDRWYDFSRMLALVNFGDALGALELSFVNGELRYRTSACVKGLTTIPAPFLRTLVMHNVQTMDRYFTEIHSVLAGDLTPELAGRLLSSAGEGEEDADA